MNKKAKKKSMKKKIYLWLCLTIVVNATGIVNTESVLIKEESDAKEKLEKIAKKIKNSIDKYRVEIDSTNQVLSAQLNELIKLREMKKKIFIENKRFFHNSK